jgi:hypothetical protein
MFTLPHRRAGLSTLVLALGLTLVSAPGALADSYLTIKDKAAFLGHVAGRTLRLSMFDVTIAVNADGSIKGRAMGWDLKGTWAWDDGLFCREIDWSGSVIPRNCQLVEVAEGQSIRFTVDGGRGRSATFRIQ